MDPFDDLDEEEEEEQKKNANLLTVAGALGQLAGNEDFADVIFLVGSGKNQRAIPGHRVLLAASSDVFEAMLYPPVFPGDSPKVHKVDPDNIPEIALPDVSPSAFRTMLKSLYSDSAEIQAEDLPDLIYLAKKFQLEGLRTACTNFMESGVTAENCCTLLLSAKGLVEEREFVFQFIEQNCDAVVQTQGWLDLPKEVVVEILSSDKLGADEVALFTAALKWAVAQCGRLGVEVTSDTKRNVLKDILPLIRFPCMAIEDIANHASPSGVLNAKELLRIFTYLGTDEKSRVGETLNDIGFPTKARVAQSNLKWTFDPKMKSGTVTISAGNLKAVTAGATAYSYVLGNTVFLAGKYAWQVTRVTGDTHALHLGVSAKKQFADNSQTDKTFWGINSGNQAIMAGAATSLTTNFTKGPLQCLLDCELGTFTIVNLSTGAKSEIKDLPKKDDIAKLDGGGYVPHFGFFNVQEVLVLPIHVGKFGKRVTV